MSDTYKPRAYYSARKYGITSAPIDLEDLRELVYNAYQHFESSGYLVDAFGFECVDSGYEPGFVGANLDVFVKMTLLKRDLWPIKDWYKEYSEDDVFTIIEFLYDHVSKPLSKHMHDWNGCGYHYSNFDRAAARVEYRERMAIPLERYGVGWELSEAGEILSLPPKGMATLLDAPLPTKDKTVSEKVADATIRYRRHGTSLPDRESAVRDLAGVLEWLRPQIKSVLLKEDEQELFNIANNFGIRHMNQNQKLAYDKVVWLSWMFYYYLNTINACLHIIKRQEEAKAA